MAEYRAGRFQSAAEWMGRAKSACPPEMPSARAAADLFIAMSLHRLGEVGQGGEAFARAAEELDRDPLVPGVDDLYREGHPENWILCEVARREAEQLFKEGSR